MKLMLGVLGIVSVAELLLYARGLWKYHRYIACVLIIALAIISGRCISYDVHSWTVLLAIGNIYRMINLLRLVEQRMQADYLYHATRKTTVFLLATQIVIVGLAALNSQVHISAYAWWFALVVGQIVVGVLLLATTIRQRTKTKALPVENSYVSKDLPSLTVALPARNETEDLEACLSSLIASTYPKLEILVLDDCSQNKRTPEIIRSYAHDGVRFIAGTAPPKQWLAKNYAYKQLAHEANGALVLFCGVDVRFSPDSLRVLVETMLEKKKTMISVMPENQLPPLTALESLLVQPARYAWELALPRRPLQRPAVLSTCWMITAEQLHAAGGFDAISRSSSPESYHARAAIRAHDGYSFMVSSPAMAIHSAKPFNEQRATAIRTRYPQLHRRPELIAYVSVLELAFLVLPVVIVIVTLVTKHWLLAILGLVATVLHCSMFGIVTSITYRRNLVRGYWLLPFAALYDVGMLNYSMWQYEFREVLWKGRNVCLPLMRTIPSFPKLK